jgi:predicted nucleic acid-binding protein
MSAVFADTFFFLAILNPSDPAHHQASEVSRNLRRPRVTTSWVLTEVGDALARDNRTGFLDLVKLL